MNEIISLKREITREEKKKKRKKRRNKRIGEERERSSDETATYLVVNGDVRHPGPGTSEHVVGVIGGKLGGVVKTSIPVRFPNDSAGQTLGPPIARALRRYPVQMLDRGFLLRCGQVITARESGEMRGKRKREEGQKEKRGRNI